jgi:hypothetical protein
MLAGIARARAIVAAIVIALAYIPSSIVLRHLHLPQLPEPLFTHLLWSTVLMFALAIDRLVRDRATTQA